MSELTLQVPDGVLDAARRLAEREHTSVEEYLARKLGDMIRQNDEWEQRVLRGRQVSRERVGEILNKVPDVPPMPGDEIE